MMKAERLILMTDVDGLFDDDPKSNPKASLITYRKKIGAAEMAMAHKKAKSAQGTGGMYSKLLAADRAGKAGIVTHMVRGDWPRNLLEVAAGKAIGTQIGGKP
jgi:glutamate 5-kinase